MRSLPRRRVGQWVTSVGRRSSDDEERRLQKSLLVASSAMMALAAIGWGLAYLALGQGLPGAIPLSYSALSFLSLAVFPRLGRYRLFRASQLALSLLLPFLLGLSLGGLVSSSGVVLWSLTCPLGALVFTGYRQARWWFVAFIATLCERTIEWFMVFNIAGVIGVRKFIDDMWGDAVNTAGRMESHGVRGMVQITRATYDLVQDDFRCQPRGTIAVTGKGDVEIWHVLGGRGPVGEPHPLVPIG